MKVIKALTSKCEEGDMTEKTRKERVEGESSYEKNI
jgi:hypothetical protein